MKSIMNNSSARLNTLISIEYISISFKRKRIKVVILLK